MTVYTEFELRCDCGMPGDPYGCEPAIYGSNKAKVLAEAKSDGWTTVKRHGKDLNLKPGHNHG